MSYPEVIGPPFNIPFHRAIPHVETPTRIHGKTVLYKGVEATDFWRAFQQGGFHPSRPDRPWLTNDVETALNYGGYSPINNPRTKTSPAQEACMLVTKPGVAEVRHFQAVGASESHVWSVGLRDYQGKESIQWSDLMCIVLTPESLIKVLNAYNGVRPGDLSAGVLAELVRVVEPSTRREFKRQVENVVAEQGPRHSLVYRPW